VSGRFFENAHPYITLSVDDYQSPDSVWLAMSDGTKRLVLYALPLGDNPQPLAVLTPPLPVLGGGSLSWGNYPSSLAGRLSMTSEGYLWLSDVENNRVLRIRNPRYNPVIDVILGSRPSTERNVIGGTVRECRAWDPLQSGTVNLDYYGNVYVGDHFLENWGNGRILEWDAQRFPTNLTQAIQGDFSRPGPFHRGSLSRGGHFCPDVNSYGTCAPMGFAFDENGYLYVGLNPYASNENYYPACGSTLSVIGRTRLMPRSRTTIPWRWVSLRMTTETSIFMTTIAPVLSVSIAPGPFRAGLCMPRAVAPMKRQPELSIRNPYTSAVTARVIWTLQAKSGGQWKTEETVITIPAGSTYTRSRTESADNLIDTTVSSESFPTSRCR